MSESVAIVNNYLDALFAYGAFWVYLAIFLACFLENLAPPFPGDSFIVAAGGLVAVTRLEAFQAVLTVVLGGMSSVMLLYLLGRRYGRGYFLRKDFRYFSSKDILAMETRFEKRGGFLLVISRFVVGLRAVLALAAGLGKYPAGKMLLYSTISYLLFGGLLMYMGFKLIENVGAITDYVRAYNTIVWPIVIMMVALYVGHRFWQLRKRNAS
jgi:membrane protein DedA with SNARE-associated domain